jgi:hypothetical protein
MSRKIVLSLAAVLVLATLVSGCGASGSSNNSTSDVAASMNAATKHVDAAIVSMNNVVDAMPAGGSLTKAQLEAAVKSLDTSASAGLASAKKELEGAAADAEAASKLDYSAYFTPKDFEAYRASIDNMLKEVVALQTLLAQKAAAPESTLTSASQGLTDFGVHHAAFLGALNRMKGAAQ